MTIINTTTAGLTSATHVKNSAGLKTDHIKTMVTTISKNKLTFVPLSKTSIIPPSAQQYANKQNGIYIIVVTCSISTKIDSASVESSPCGNRPKEVLTEPNDSMTDSMLED